MNKHHDFSINTCPQKERHRTEDTATPHWDCHQHRDELRVSNASTIYHPKRGQLCQVEKRYDAVLYHPIRFSNPAAAWQWIKTGCIADLQQSLSSLGVGFATTCFSEKT